MKIIYFKFSPKNYENVVEFYVITWVRADWKEQWGIYFEYEGPKGMSVRLLKQLFDALKMKIFSKDC